MLVELHPNLRACRRPSPPTPLPRGRGEQRLFPSPPGGEGQGEGANAPWRTPFQEGLALPPAPGKDVVGMSDTQTLMTKIGALRQRLELAQGLVRDADFLPASLEAPGGTRGEAVRRLERHVQ